MKNSPLKISNITIQPGERVNLALPTPEIYTCAPVYVPIHVIHGKKAGPTLLICGAIHGDAINGVAIIQRLLKLRMLGKIRGTLIIIPTINIYGMMTLSRNLPDRRDPDGSFPGSQTGSFASRLAYFLTQEVFSHITHCIDLHTGEAHIAKFPHVKTSMNHPEAKELAHNFQAPVILNTESTQGLLWLLHRSENPIPTIVYETGEALRLDDKGIKIGTQGIVRVMKSLNMLPDNVKGLKPNKSTELISEYWVRAPASGLCEVSAKVGSFVSKGDTIATLLDPFGTEQNEKLIAPFDGIVIAHNHLPILNEGEPIVQLAELKRSEVEDIQDWKEKDGAY